MIDLTSEQAAAVECDHSIFLSACPGSGKTRVILSKALRTAEEVRNTPRKICCITYTNAAVEEIESRLRIYGSPEASRSVEVSTIHSFCLSYVLRTFSWLNSTVPQGFKVLVQEMQECEDIVSVVEDELGRRVGNRSFDDYASLTIEQDGSIGGLGLTHGSVTSKGAARFFEICLSRGFLTFSMILYFACDILSKHPFVAKGLASRFAWFLIDEFQDTSSLQLEILRCIDAQALCRFFLVGDENQSIYSFAGANPGSALRFARDIGCDFSLQLTGNFRCGSEITAAAERLIPRKPPMVVRGPAATWTVTPLVQRAADNVSSIVDSFLPWVRNEGVYLGRTAILAPWWQHLLPIARALRSNNVPVFGPGARPYQRRRLFAGLAEQLGACATTPDLLGLPGVEKALFLLVSEVVGQTRWDLFSYEGRCLGLELIYTARLLAEKSSNAAWWLDEASRAVEDILIRTEFIPASTRGLLSGSVDLMKRDMQRRSDDPSRLQVADLGLFAYPDRAVKLITLHNSKGREFDAVALININEGAIPHFTARTVEDFEEAKRVFYVGMTRAKKLLFVSYNTMDARNPASRFIRQCLK